MDEFTCWLEKRKEDLRVKACCAAPDEFKDWEVEWNWEVSSLFIFCFGYPSVELISGVGFYF